MAPATPDAGEPVDERHVAAAEKEAAEAVALVAALEARVVDGDESITHDEIEQAKSLGKFAKLRAQATARKAEKARAAARLARLEQLAGEMRAHQTDAGKVIDLMLQMEAAAKGLIDLCAQRGDDLTAWRRVMHELDVPEAGQAAVAEHGRVGWRGHSGDVLVDDKVIRNSQPGQFVITALARVIRATGNPLPIGGMTLAGVLPYTDTETPTDSDTYREQLARLM